MVSVHTIRRLVRENPGLTSKGLYYLLPSEEKGVDVTEQRLSRHQVSIILSRLVRKGELAADKQLHPPCNKWFPTEALKSD